jgi:hypothetical protein
MNLQRLKGAFRVIFGVLLPACGVAQAQFTYTNADGSIYDYSTNADGVSVTITGYTGPPWAVTIPTNIAGLTVTGIGENAFEYSFSLSDITIPDSVTSIGEDAFGSCYRLTAITVDAQNAFYSSTNGVLFDKTQTVLLQYPGGLGGSYGIPGSVTGIGTNAFSGCDLTSVVMPNSISNIGEFAFSYTGLTGIYFEGNAPEVGLDMFSQGFPPTVYYLAGTTGWSNTFAGVTAILWNPLIQTGDGLFGIHNNQFKFTITNGGISNIPIVVEACTNLASPVWTPLATLTLTNSYHFGDSQWTNYSGRFYRIRSP